MKIKSIVFLFIIILIVAFTVLYNNKQTEIMVNTKNSETLNLPILMYHQVKNFKTGKNVITPYEFESDLKFLKANSYNTITMTQLIDYVYDDKPLPGNSIILSFDDSYLNTYRYVYPLLQKYDMKIVLSIIGIDTDNFTSTPSSSIDTSHMTWEQIKELSDSRFVEVQNHSYNMHSKTKNRIGCTQNSGEKYEDYEKALSDDINRLQEKIYYYTGKEPNTFTYPFGRYSQNTVDVIKKLNIKASLSCDYGINQITKNPDCLYSLKRICRSHGVSVEKLLNDVYKTIHN